MGNYSDLCELCGGGGGVTVQWLEVVVFVVIVRVLALVVDFREGMVTSPLDLAKCGPH